MKDLDRESAHSREDRVEFALVLAGLFEPAVLLGGEGEALGFLGSLAAATVGAILLVAIGRLFAGGSD